MIYLRIALFVLGLVLFAPMLVGLIDIWSWLMVGHQVSWVTWDEGRIAITPFISSAGAPCIFAGVAIES